MERARVAYWIFVIQALLIHTHGAPADGQLQSRVDLKPNLLSGDGKTATLSSGIGNAHNFTNELFNNINNQTINESNEHGNNITSTSATVQTQNIQPTSQMENILINAVKSSKSLVDLIGGDNDYAINVNDLNSTKNSTMHIIKIHHNNIINHVNDHKNTEDKTLTEKLLDNSFDSILSQSVSSFIHTGGNPKSKRVFPVKNKNISKINSESVESDNSAPRKLNVTNDDYKTTHQEYLLGYGETQDINTSQNELSSTDSLPYNSFNKSFPLRPLKRQKNVTSVTIGESKTKSFIDDSINNPITVIREQNNYHSTNDYGSNTKFSDSPIPIDFEQTFHTSGDSIENSYEKSESEEDNSDHRPHFVNGPHGIDFSSNTRLKNPSQNRRTNDQKKNSHETISQEKQSVNSFELKNLINSQISNSQVNNVLAPSGDFINNYTSIKHSQGQPEDGERQGLDSSVQLKEPVLQNHKKAFNSQENKNLSQALVRGISSLNTFRQFFENDGAIILNGNLSETGYDDISKNNIPEINISSSYVESKMLSNQSDSSYPNENKSFTNILTNNSEGNHNINLSNKKPLKVINLFDIFNQTNNLETNAHSNTKGTNNFVIDILNKVILGREELENSKDDGTNISGEKKTNNHAEESKQDGFNKNLNIDNTSNRGKVKFSGQTSSLDGGVTASTGFDNTGKIRNVSNARKTTTSNMVSTKTESSDEDDINFQNYPPGYLDKKNALNQESKNNSTQSSFEYTKKSSNTATSQIAKGISINSTMNDNISKKQKDLSISNLNRNIEQNIEVSSTTASVLKGMYTQAASINTTINSDNLKDSPHVLNDIKNNSTLLGSTPSSVSSSTIDFNELKQKYSTDTINQRSSEKYNANTSYGESKTGSVKQIVTLREVIASSENNNKGVNLLAIANQNVGSSISKTNQQTSQVDLSDTNINVKLEHHSNHGIYENNNTKLNDEKHQENVLNNIKNNLTVLSSTSPSVSSSTVDFNELKQNNSTDTIIQRGSEKYNGNTSYGDSKTGSVKQFVTLREVIASSENNNKGVNVLSVANQNVDSSISKTNQHTSQVDLSDKSINVQLDNQSNHGINENNNTKLNDEKHQDNSELLKLTVISKGNKIELNNTNTSDNNRSNKSLRGNNQSINIVTIIPKEDFKQNGQSAITKVQNISSIDKSLTDTYSSELKSDSVLKNKEQSRTTINSASGEILKNILISNTTIIKNNPEGTTTGILNNNTKEVLASDKNKDTFTSNVVSSKSETKQETVTLTTNENKDLEDVNINIKNNNSYTNSTTNKFNLESPALQTQTNSFPSNFEKVLQSMALIDSNINKTFQIIGNVTNYINSAANISSEKTKKMSNDINLQKIYELEKETLKLSENLNNGTLRIANASDNNTANISLSLVSKNNVDNQETQNTVNLESFNNSLGNSNKYTAIEEVVLSNTAKEISEYIKNENSDSVSKNLNSKKSDLNIILKNENTNKTNIRDINGSEDLSSLEGSTKKSEINNRGNISFTNTKIQIKSSEESVLLNNNNKYDTSINEPSHISDSSDSQQRKTSGGKFEIEIDGNKSLLNVKRTNTILNNGLISNKNIQSEAPESTIKTLIGSKLSNTNNKISTSSQNTALDSELHTSTTSSTLFSLKSQQSQITTPEKISSTVQLIDSQKKSFVEVTQNVNETLQESSNADGNKNQSFNTNKSSTGRGNRSFQLTNSNNDQLVDIKSSNKNVLGNALQEIENSTLNKLIIRAFNESGTYKYEKNNVRKPSRLFNNNLDVTNSQSVEPSQKTESLTINQQQTTTARKSTNGLVNNNLSITNSEGIESLQEKDSVGSNQRQKSTSRKTSSGLENNNSNVANFRGIKSSQEKESIENSQQQKSGSIKSSSGFENENSNIANVRGFKSSQEKESFENSQKQNISSRKSSNGLENNDSNVSRSRNIDSSQGRESFANSQQQNVNTKTYTESSSYRNQNPSSNVLSGRSRNSDSNQRPDSSQNILIDNSQESESFENNQQQKGISRKPSNGLENKDPNATSSTSIDSSRGRESLASNQQQIFNSKTYTESSSYRNRNPSSNVQTGDISKNSDGTQKSDTSQSSLAMNLQEKETFENNQQRKGTARKSSNELENKNSNATSSTTIDSSQGGKSLASNQQQNFNPKTYTESTSYRNRNPSTNVNSGDISRNSDNTQKSDTSQSSLPIISQERESFENNQQQKGTARKSSNELDNINSNATSLTSTNSSQEGESLASNQQQTFNSKTYTESTSYRNRNPSSNVHSKDISKNSDITQKSDSSHNILTINLQDSTNPTSVTETNTDSSTKQINGLISNSSSEKKSNINLTNAESTANNGDSLTIAAERNTSLNNSKSKLHSQTTTVTDTLINQETKTKNAPKSRGNINWQSLNSKKTQIDSNNQSSLNYHSNGDSQQLTDVSGIDSPATNQKNIDVTKSYTETSSYRNPELRKGNLSGRRGSTNSQADSQPILSGARDSANTNNQELVNTNAEERKKQVTNPLENNASTKNSVGSQSSTETTGDGQKIINLNEKEVNGAEYSQFNKNDQKLIDGEKVSLSTSKLSTTNLDRENLSNARRRGSSQRTVGTGDSTNERRELDNSSLNLSPTVSGQKDTISNVSLAGSRSIRRKIARVSGQFESGEKTIISNATETNPSKTTQLESQSPSSSHTTDDKGFFSRASSEDIIRSNQDVKSTDSEQKRKQNLVINNAKASIQQTVSKSESQHGNQNIGLTFTRKPNLSINTAETPETGLDADDLNVARGGRKFIASKFETISPLSTDSHYKNLYPDNPIPTSSSFNDLSGRYKPRNVVKFTTKNLETSANQYSVDTANVNAAEETRKKNRTQVFRGNIKFVWDPLSADQFYGDSGTYPRQFLFNYKTPEGISAYQKGTLKEINDQKVFIVQGSYEYTSPDGTPILVNYTADENGFHPQLTALKNNTAEEEITDSSEKKNILPQNNKIIPF